MKAVKTPAARPHTPGGLQAVLAAMTRLWGVASPQS